MIQGELFDEGSDRAESTGEPDRKALDELVEQALAYKSGPELKELFDFAKKFPHLAPFNAMLLHIQNPGIQFALSATDWKEKYGRRIRPKARPYVILWPMAPVHFLFDLSETEPIDPKQDRVPSLASDPFPSSGGVQKSMMRRMWRNAEKLRIEIQMFDGATGGAGQVSRYQGPTYDFVISLNEKHSDLQQFGTLAHELGHLFCGHIGGSETIPVPDRSGLTEEICEFEAEAVAHLVTSRMRLDIQSHVYLSSYFSESKPLPKFSLEAILTAARKVEDLASGSIRLRKGK